MDHIIQPLAVPATVQESQTASGSTPITTTPTTGSRSSTPQREREAAAATSALANTPPRESRVRNPVPQTAPGASSAVGHTVDNSIPLSIFPIATDKFCFCFCGLPGRGKTHISRKLARYLSFFHAMPVKLFNVSEYRRQNCGVIQDAMWFDPTNKESEAVRVRCNEQLADDALEFLKLNSNGVAIIDSVNGTIEKREKLVTKLRPSGAKIVFIEVQNSDEAFLSELYRQAAMTSPDYKGMNISEAETDYRRRVGKYEEFYEPLDTFPLSRSSPSTPALPLPLPVPTTTTTTTTTASSSSSSCCSSSSTTQSPESRWSYLKCDLSKRHFVIHNVGGYLPLKAVHFIMNLNTSFHPFYLSRHGQSEYNAVGRIGGDSGLTQHGLNYAKALAYFVDNNIVKNPSTGEDVPARLWTSTLRRTKETGQYIKQSKILIPDRSDPSLQVEWVQMRPREWSHLDELFAGACDGMTYEEIEQNFPEEFSRRNVDKLAYRYPRGESYLDVIARLEPIIIEMERHTEPLLIIGHQGILRIIYAFYMGLSRAEAPYVSVPLNCVLEIGPSVYGCSEKRHVLYTPQRALPTDGQDEPSQPFNNDPQSH